MALAVRTVVGFVVAAALLLINARGSYNSRRFLSHGEATLWLTLLAVQAAFWAAVTSYAWKMARHYFPRTRRDFERIAAPLAVIFMLLIGVPFATRVVSSGIFPDHCPKLPVCWPPWRPRDSHRA